ncbi:hypothetical protein FF38_06036 [Lucilia cuprina]|uniref:Uncharacterized protein n=1 Tax=Lucilia cuprina TaxID=7375 RepID=A0A0L0BXP7_LUCCU|nr:hypothetical protein FF38_06036 [Lucilia cuprina]
MIDFVNLDLESCIKSVNEFQSTPNLLDKDIPHYINTLTSEYSTTNDSKYLHIIYTLCKIRGFKIISQQFPTNTETLVKIFTDLQNTSHSDWQKSIQPNLESEIYNYALQFLETSGIQRDACSVLLGRLLTRKLGNEVLIAQFCQYFKSSSARFIGGLQTLSVLINRVQFIPEAIPGSDLELQNAFELDPESRAFAVSQINNHEYILKGLKDYTIDIRGDIGSIVRTAALLRVQELQIRTPEIETQVWKIASESRTKTRIVAFQVLRHFNYDINEYADLLKCPPFIRPVLARGIVSCLGSNKSNSNTIKETFNTILLNYFSDSPWLIPEILNIERINLGTTRELISTVQKLVIYGLDFPSLKPLAIAFNLSLRTNLPEPILQSCIDILQYYVPHVNAIKGLKRLANCANVYIKQRACEALFECGMADNAMIDQSYSSSLEVSLKSNAKTSSNVSKSGTLGGSLG